MPSKNICGFIPFHENYHSIHTVNFVLETEPRRLCDERTESLYKMYFVRTGRGTLHMRGKRWAFASGDVFFTFPGTAFRIEADGACEYLYIAFLGSRANMIMEKLGVSNAAPLFPGLNKVRPFWEEGIGMAAEPVLELISESVLLYTFSCMGRALAQAEKPAESGTELCEAVKKYIDSHFEQSDLSTDSVSRCFGYNKKYLSSVFKKATGSGIAEYITTVRVQSACTLMRQGYTNVANIARSCGCEDPHYFSKMFKKRMLLSPRQYIEKL